MPGPVVVDPSLSPQPLLRPGPPTAVRLTDAFRQPRPDANRRRPIPTRRDKLESSGTLSDFRRAVVAKSDGPFAGFILADSDVYTWLEAASSVATNPDPELGRQVNEVAAAAGAEHWSSDLLGGVVTLRTAGHARAADDGWLYRTARATIGPTTPVAVTAVPYFAWANRDAGATRVWLPIAAAGL